MCSSDLVVGEGSDAALLLKQPDIAMQFDRKSAIDGQPFLPRISGRYASVETDTEVRIHAEGPAHVEMRGPYGRSLWRLEALVSGSHEHDDIPEFWLLRPLEPAPVRWIALHLVVRDAAVQALEINTPRTWALHFDRI